MNCFTRMKGKCGQKNFKVLLMKVQFSSTTFFPLFDTIQVKEIIYELYYRLYYIDDSLITLNAMFLGKHITKNN